METKEIAHRLGNIQYQYDATRPWTDADQQLHDHITHTIARLEAFQESAEKILDDAANLSNTIKDRQALHREVGEKLNAAREKANRYIAELEMKRPNLSEELSEAINTANDAIQIQNASIRKTHTTYAELLDRTNQLQEAFLQYSEESNPQGSELFVQHANNDTLATDIMSFYNAEERLTDLYSHYHRRIESLIDHSRSVSSEFETLCIRVEWQQDVWTELCSRLVLIEYIGKLNSGTHLTSLN